MTPTTIILPRRRNPGRADSKFLRRELETAGALQQQLLPRTPCTIGDVRLCAVSIPAGSLAGDWYDIVAHSDGRITVGLGDVSGKGAGAALLAARVSAELAAAARNDAQPSEMLAAANARLCACEVTGQFASALQVSVERTSASLRIANAGHMAPLLRENDCVRALGLTRAGPALGVLEEAEYWSAEYRFVTGSMLLLYSDGISEARDRRGRMFGETRIARLLRCAPASPEGVVRALFEAIAGFTGGGPQDDATAVCLMRSASTRRAARRHTESVAAGRRRQTVSQFSQRS